MHQLFEYLVNTAPRFMFPTYSLRKLRNRYIALPLLRLTPLPPTEGFPWDDLRKIFRKCQRMAMVAYSEE